MCVSHTTVAQQKCCCATVVWLSYDKRGVARQSYDCRTKNYYWAIVVWLSQNKMVVLRQSYDSRVTVVQYTFCRTTVVRLSYDCRVYRITSISKKNVCQNLFKKSFFRKSKNSINATVVRLSSNTTLVVCQSYNYRTTKLLFATVAWLPTTVAFTDFFIFSKK